MGTICILIGLIVLLAFTGGGFLVSNVILEKFAFTFKALNPTSVYVGVVGVCAFIGLLICLNLVMNGLIYNRVCKNASLMKKNGR